MFFVLNWNSFNKKTIETKHELISFRVCFLLSHSALFGYLYAMQSNSLNTHHTHWQYYIYIYTCVSFVYIRLRGRNERELNRNEHFGTTFFIFHNLQLILFDSAWSRCTDRTRVSLARGDCGEHSMGVNNTDVQDVNAFVAKQDIRFNSFQDRPWRPSLLRTA